MSSKGSKMKRRGFLKYSLTGLGGLSLLSALPACSTFDEYLFDEHEFLKDQVIIIGGGITGLYLAQKLRQLKTEFRLFEGSSVFGGRIRSSNELDLGASVFEQTDVHLKKLVQDLNLSETALGKSQFVMNTGAEVVTQGLQHRIGGLIPYRSLRLQWKLLGIRKVGGNYDLTFNTPGGVRSILAKKLVLTIPPSQWNQIQGLLELPEMKWAASWLRTLEAENVFKLAMTVSNNLPGLSAYNKKHKVLIPMDVGQTLSVLVRPMKNNTSVIEFELTELLSSTPEISQKSKKPILEIENFLTLVATKTKLGLNVKKIAADSFFNWSQVQLIQGAYFKNSVPFPQSQFSGLNRFQVIGDYTSLVKPHTVEGALTEAERISQIFV